eukprot:364630-Chlamydomonas_euryale.AAC.27
MHVMRHARARPVHTPCVVMCCARAWPVHTPCVVMRCARACHAVCWSPARPGHAMPHPLCPGHTARRRWQMRAGPHPGPHNPTTPRPSIPSPEGLACPLILRSPGSSLLAHLQGTPRRCGSCVGRIGGNPCGPRREGRRGNLRRLFGVQALGVRWVRRNAASRRTDTSRRDCLRLAEPPPSAPEPSRDRFRPTAPVTVAAVVARRGVLPVALAAAGLPARQSRGTVVSTRRGRTTRAAARQRIAVAAPL